MKSVKARTHRKQSVVVISSLRPRRFGGLLVISNINSTSKSGSATTFLRTKCMKTMKLNSDIVYYRVVLPNDNATSRKSVEI